MTATAALQRLAAEYWEFRLREYPVLAHDVGDSRNRRHLFHESIADLRLFTHTCRLVRFPVDKSQGAAAASGKR